MNKQQLLKLLTKEEESLLRALRGLDEAALTTEPVFEDWTIKDIVGHVVSWGDEFRAEIRAIRASPAPAYGYLISSEDQYREWNMREAARKQSWPWSKIQEDLERDGQEMAALLQQLSDAELGKRGVVPWHFKTLKIGWLISTHYIHMREHTALIRKWRAQRGDKGFRR